MFSSIIRKSFMRTKLHRLYMSLACNNYTLATNQCRFKKSVLQCITLKHNIIYHRKIWNVNKNELTDFLPLLPGRVKKYMTFLSFLRLPTIDIMMQATIDTEFSFKTVLNTAKSAASNVSIELANQNYSALNGLVEQETLKMLEERINSLNEEQRKLLVIKEENIIKYFIVDVNVGDVDRTYSTISFLLNVNIAILYNPLDASDNSNISKPLFANYTFSGECTEKGCTNWIIKYINIST